MPATPLIRRCPVDGTLFEAKGRRTFCQPSCNDRFHNARRVVRNGRRVHKEPSPTLIDTAREIEAVECERCGSPFGRDWPLPRCLSCEVQYRLEIESKRDAGRRRTQAKREERLVIHLTRMAAQAEALVDVE